MEKYKPIKIKYPADVHLDTVLEILSRMDVDRIYCNFQPSIDIKMAYYVRKQGKFNQWVIKLKK